MPSDRLWTCGILSILITKKDHDDGNHYFNILKRQCFLGEFWSEKGRTNSSSHTFCAWREFAYSRAIDKSSGAGCSKVMDGAIDRIRHYQIQWISIRKTNFAFYPLDRYLFEWIRVDTL